MYYNISGEFIDGDNFVGKWLGVDAETLEVNEANESEVLYAITSSIRDGSCTMIKLSNGDIYNIFPNNIRRLKVTRVSV